MPKSDNKKIALFKIQTAAKILLLLAVFSMAYFAVGFLSKNGIKNAVKETANFVLKADAASSCPGLPSVVYDGDTYDTVLIDSMLAKTEFKCYPYAIRRSFNPLLL